MPKLLRLWGFTFFEAPETDCPSARLLWHARLDPGVLVVEASPALSHKSDAFDLDRFEAFAIVAKDMSGKEHIALSNGYRRIRMDVVSGTLLEGPVVLTHRLSGLSGLNPKLRALRRLIALTRTQLFGASLFPVASQTTRLVAALQVFDGLLAGASQRDIAAALYGQERVATEWNSASDSMRSRVRRLIGIAHDLAAGGWQKIML